MKPGQIIELDCVKDEETGKVSYRLALVEEKEIHHPKMGPGITEDLVELHEDADFPIMFYHLMKMVSPD